MKFLLPGLAFIGLGILDIYTGRSSFFLIGQRWMWPHFNRDEHPRMFWFCVSLEFLIALLCFGAAILDGVASSLLDS